MFIQLAVFLGLLASVASQTAVPGPFICESSASSPVDCKDDASNCWKGLFKNCGSGYADGEGIDFGQLVNENNDWCAAFNNPRKLLGFHGGAPWTYNFDCWPVVNVTTPAANISLTELTTAVSSLALNTPGGPTVACTMDPAYQPSDVSLGDNLYALIFNVVGDYNTGACTYNGKCWSISSCTVTANFSNDPAPPFILQRVVMSPAVNIGASLLLICCAVFATSLLW